MIDTEAKPVMTHGAPKSDRNYRQNLSRFRLFFFSHFFFKIQNGLFSKEQGYSIFFFEYKWYMYFFLQNETFKRPWEVLASHTYFSSNHVSVELESLQDDCCLYKSDVIFQSSMSFLLGGILSLEAEVCDLHHSLFLGLLCGIRMGLCHLLCQGLTTTKRQQVVVTKWHWMVGCCIFGIWSIDKHWTQHQTNKRCFFPSNGRQCLPISMGAFISAILAFMMGGEPWKRSTGGWAGDLLFWKVARKTGAALNFWVLENVHFNVKFSFFNLKLSWGPTTESFPCGCNILQVCCRNFWGRGLLWPILFVVEGILGLPMQMAVFLNGGPMEIAVGGHRCCDAIPGWWSKGCYLWNEDVNPNWNWLILVTVVNLWKSLGP